MIGYPAGPSTQIAVMPWYLRRVSSFSLSALAQGNALAKYLHYVRKVENSAPSKLLAALPRCTDEDDQKFLELARDSRAKWLITSDRALLKLNRRLKQSGLFMVITPEAALTET